MQSVPALAIQLLQLVSRLLLEKSIKLAEKVFVENRFDEAVDLYGQLDVFACVTMFWWPTR